MPQPPDLNKYAALRSTPAEIPPLGKGRFHTPPEYGCFVSTEKYCLHSRHSKQSPHSSHTGVLIKYSKGAFRTLLPDLSSNFATLCSARPLNSKYEIQNESCFVSCAGNSQHPFPNPTTTGQKEASLFSHLALHATVVKQAEHLQSIQPKCSAFW